MPADQFDQVVDALPFSNGMSSATGASGHSHSNAPITLSSDELILHSDEGIPYVIPEVALLFEAKHLRLKDQDDFRNVLPALTQSRRLRLHDRLTQIHPGHPWIDALHDRE